MFHATSPANLTASPDSSGLQHLSDFQHLAPALASDAHAGHTRLACLSPSLLQDLQCGEAVRAPDAGLDLLEVLAAALRHGRALQVHLELDYRVVPLAVWPQTRLVHSPLSLDRLLALRLPDLRVLLVQPSLTEPPAGTAANAGTPASYASPLASLLWELALRGPRGALLPQIGGSAAYRVSPASELGALALVGTLAVAVERLRRDSVPLREIASWPGFDLDRANRLLNGLYLQAALIVSRSHPSAQD